MPLSPFTVDFYQRASPEVARSLLGAHLVRRLDGKRVSGYIMETEAYWGESDLACHARAGRTSRTAIMYGPGGRAYIYFIYGMYWMLNCVTGGEGDPQAVLIRAIWPHEGLEEIAARRIGAPLQKSTNGPGKICTALQIDRRLNGANLTDPHSELIIEPGFAVQDEHVMIGPRVGIQNVPEPWRSQPWRFRTTPQNWNLPSGAYVR